MAKVESQYPVTVTFFCGSDPYPPQTIESGVEPMIEKVGELEIVRGSGNIFRDLGHPNADVEQMKAILAARIIGVLDDEGLSTRKAQEATGINHADFTRIRTVKLDRFTIDRLVTILNRLGRRVDLKVNVRPIRAAAAAARRVSSQQRA